MNTGRPVKYAGLDVGRVEAIVLDPKDPRYIRVRIGVHRDFPLYQGTVARIAQKGLVGDYYVLLEIRGEPGERLAPLADIPAVATMDVQELAAKAGEMLDDIQPKIKYIRFFPRTITLAPNESQVIKMQLNKAGKLAAGEYRSHIYFRALPKEKPLGEEEASKDTAAISIKLVPIFGITIPVIIRVGETSAKVELTNISLQIVNDTLPKLSMKFIRSGNNSVFGDIQVDYISPQGKVIT